MLDVRDDPAQQNAGNHPPDERGAAAPESSDWHGDDLDDTPRGPAAMST
jgi:hypothetical protein